MLTIDINIENGCLIFFSAFVDIQKNSFYLK